MSLEGCEISAPSRELSAPRFCTGMTADAVRRDLSSLRSIVYSSSGACVVSSLHEYCRSHDAAVMLKCSHAPSTRWWPRLPPPYTPYHAFKDCCVGDMKDRSFSCFFPSALRFRVRVDAAVPSHAGAALFPNPRPLSWPLFACGGVIISRSSETDNSSSSSSSSLPQLGAAARMAVEVEAAAAETKPTTGEVTRHPLRHRCVSIQT